MSITGKNLTWMLGLAAATAVALLAKRTNTEISRIASKKGAGYRPGSMLTRHLYDDSEIHFI